ncbi:MAG: hypothetical protein CVU15_03035 [Betaproteobacteria bacterium HGW-Betaproteobacteria-1]|jgi:hypothetical protein|nr:MAG: hypothetical protein CVU15_03035 [Betaproteobacteria bacterium HGW-Betaproteobacteria-1]
MNNERELLTRHLKELLELVENKDSDLSQVRHWIRYWWWDHPTGDEIASRLRRIERRLESLEPQRCALAEGDRADRIMHLVTGLEGKHREERRHITSWLSGTSHLTVVDPYFFSFSGSNKIYRTQAQYVESIIELLPKTLESIEVFHLPGPNRAIFSSIEKHCRKKNISLRNWGTTEVHDRVLIKNETEARALGTSFGGLGNKIAFVLDLPQEDLEIFRRELHRIKSVA